MNKRITMNEVNNFRSVQHNIRKACNRYQVRKMLRGKPICKSFSKLKDARAYLKTLV